MEKTTQLFKFEDGTGVWVPCQPIPYFKKRNLIERIFGMVSEKKLITQAVRIYLYNDTDGAAGDTPEARVRDLYYRMGNANALDGVCAALGIDLIEYVKSEKKMREKANAPCGGVRNGGT